MTRYKDGWVDAAGVFGSAPIRREGEAVKYDFNEDGTFLPVTVHEIEIDFGESNNEVINE